MTNHFEQLPWFLKEYVHRNGWNGFRDIQTRSFDIFAGSDDHILISAGTSSGKTEAAMFPVIASLYNNPCEGIGALYIGPLKALIDDQFARMEMLLRDSYIPVTGWHGDIPQNVKDRLMRHPEGILQITPESLQNIIADSPETLRRLFGSLRFVVIDEVHAFMDSDRGRQLQCCLQRLEVSAGCDPRRIGLSATISDLGAAAEWLSADTGRRASVVSDPMVGKRDISIQYNYIPVEGEEDDLDRKRGITRYYRRLYEDVRGRDCIVFVNSRSEAEITGRSLKKVAETYGEKDLVHVHHGSISGELRKAAEKALKDPVGKAAVVATVTLELGIDIGGLDGIVQIGSPMTCSSMVQRVGRSGRRGNRQCMTIICNGDPVKWWSYVEGVDTNLVKAVALTLLVLRENWTEPPSPAALPYGLLYHQTMEYLRAGLGAKFPMLVSDVLSMYPFREITQEDYRILIGHMVNQDQLVQMEDGTLLIGPKGERTVFNRDFCSVFKVRKEVEVMCEGKPVGSIQELPEVGDLIQLAGGIWEVVEVKEAQLTVNVVESDGNANNPWKSGTPPLDPRVMEMMRAVLRSDRRYPFLDEAGNDALDACRATARECGMTELFTYIDSDTIRIHPWVGTVQFDTLRRIIENMDGVDSVRYVQPYFIDVTCDMTPERLIEGVRRFVKKGDPESLVTDRDLVRTGKYDRFVPPALQSKAYARDRLDFDFELDPDSRSGAVEQALRLVLRLAGRVHPELLVVTLVHRGDYHRGVDVGAPEHGQRGQRLLGLRVMVCHDGQGDQHLVQVEPGVLVPKVIYLEPLHGLDHIGGDQHHLVVYPRQGLQRVEQHGGRSGEQRRRLALDDHPGRQLRGHDRPVGLRHPLPHGVDNLAVRDIDAGLLHQDLRLEQDAVIDAALLAVPERGEVAPDDLLVGGLPDLLVIDDAVPRHVHPHVRGGPVEGPSEDALQDGIDHGEHLDVPVVIDSGLAIGLEVERVDHVLVVEVRGGGLVSDVHGVVQRDVPYGERLELGVPRGDPPALLVVELRQAHGHLAAARTGGGDDDQGLGGLDEVVPAVTLIAGDQVDIRGIALDRIVPVHLEAQDLRLLLELIGRRLSGILGDYQAANVDAAVGEGIY